MPKTRTNADRFGLDPLIGKRGKAIFPQMTEGQTALLLFICRNRFCTFRQMHGFLGGDAYTIRRNLRLFKAANVRFIRIADQDRDERNHLQPNHYEIDDRGVAYLASGGLIASEPRRPRVSNFKHALLATEGMSSIEAGVASCSYASLIDWAKISESLPPQTAELAHPFGIPCVVDGEDTHAHADSPPFGIRLELPERTKTRFFPGIEADTGMKKREQMIEQFAGYLDIEKNHQYVEHFGFKKFSLYIPFLVKNHYQIDRIQWLKEIILDITDGAGSKSILFQQYDPEGEPGYVVTRDWQRAGHPALNLLK